MPKDVRYLSKRRKNQLINNELHCHDSFLSQSIVRNISVSPVHEAIDESVHVALSKHVNELDALIELQAYVENKHTDHNESQNDTSVTLEDIIDYKDTTTLRIDVQKLIIENNIAHSIANKLLLILRKHGHIELPSDVRVLLQTPRNVSANFKIIGNGNYVHFGLSSALEQSIKIYINFLKTKEIKLNLNIDGLPLCKSSGSQFWPIMASIEDIDVYTKPFIIGVYHGMCKPTDANEFLTDFVNEFIVLSQRGITVYNEMYTVVINAIICDTPARSFITYTKGHTGYFSCPKCIQEGEFFNNRVIFPKTDCTLRTNETFVNRTHNEHHIGNSILENLSIGMVSQIPLDYMHLVCLGVMKRLLQLWLKGNKNVRLSAEHINSISYNLIAIRSCIPSEFARKPRSLHDLERWKATEFRQFLLYTGIVIMKSIMRPIQYDHFVSFSVAIRILSDPQLCISFNFYANLLLVWFVSNYKNIYGGEYLSYNVHNLIHLANDVKIFGCLDNFSCFKFENHMQKIKNKLHQSGKPLQELSNRMFEELQVSIQPYNCTQYPVVVYKDRSNNKDISYLQFKCFKIAINKSDNCALLDDNSVLFILDIFEQNQMICVRAQRFINPKSLFITPCDSRSLNIFVLSNTTKSDIITIPVARIQNKCLKLKYLNEINSYVVISMLPLHFTNN